MEGRRKSTHEHVEFRSAPPDGHHCDYDFSIRLQKAGFKYLKTYKTVPGPMNYHQAVTRWMIER